MKTLSKYMYLLAVLPFLSCGSGGGDDPEPEPNVPDPSAAALVFPANNEECNEGTILSEEESQLTFEWGASENTDSYTLKLKDLESGSESSTNTTSTELRLTIKRGNAYSWSVVSKANATTATAESDTWRFYNAGPAIENYAPFPAYDPSPAMGVAVNAGALTLGWEATDLDGEELGFAIYLGTATPPTTLLGETDTNSYTTTVNTNTVYYWRIVSTDTSGNSSQSEIFEFRTNP
jgi:outer membrane lipoprotein-sorting protein